MSYFTYIMCSRPGGALYTGSTNDLRRRVEAHRAGSVSGHTKRYKIKTLIWFEVHETYGGALERERRIKRWRRSWKDQLIIEGNPEWRDVTSDIPM